MNCSRHNCDRADPVGALGALCCRFYDPGVPPPSGRRADSAAGNNSGADNCGKCPKYHAVGPGHGRGHRSDQVRSRPNGAQFSCQGAGGGRAQLLNRTHVPSLSLPGLRLPHRCRIDAVLTASMSHRCRCRATTNSNHGPSLLPRSYRYGKYPECRNRRGTGPTRAGAGGRGRGRGRGRGPGPARGRSPVSRTPRLWERHRRPPPATGWRGGRTRDAVRSGP